jgi:membrane dipeptidase
VPEREAALDALSDKYGPESRLSVEAAPAYLAERRKIEARYPVKRATLDDYMAHLLHIIKVAGVDHVGVGADWDGGGGVEGMEDVSALPLVTARLLAAGYGEDDVRKIWGGNLLRVLREAQSVAEPSAKP